MMLRNLIIILISFIFTVELTGQQLSSVEKIIRSKRASDTVKLNAYLQLVQELSNYSVDSALMILSEAEKYAIESISHPKKAGYSERLNEQLAELYQTHAALLYRNDELISAIAYLTKALAVYEKLQDTFSQAQVESQLADIFYVTNLYTKAKEYYTRSLNHTDSTSLQYAQILKSLANVYFEEGDLTDATAFLHQSLNIYQNLDTTEAINILLSLSHLYKQIGDTVSALRSLERIWKMRQKITSDTIAFNLMLSLGELYLSTGMVDSAFNYFIAAYGIANNLSPKFQSYAQYYIAKVYYLRNNLNRAEELALKSFRAARFEHDTLQLIKVAQLLKEINLSQGNCPQALRYANLSSEMQKDYLIRISKQSIQTIKQQEIRKNKLALDSIENQLIAVKRIQSEQERKFKQTLSMGLLFIAFLMLFVVLLAFRRRQAADLHEEHSQSEYETAEELSRLVKQNENLEHYRKEFNLLLSRFEKDFENARVLISSLLPSEEILKPKVESLFKIYIPKEELSGDFYWWFTVEDLILIAVGDTTGSGISGALICSLVIGILNEAVSIKKMTQPAQILEYVREGLIVSRLNPHDNIKLSIIVYDTILRKISYTGAKQGIYIVSKSAFNIENLPSHKIQIHIHSEYNLLELKPNIISLGVLGREHQLETLSLEHLPVSTSIYLYSDGFINQFGGEFYEKFGRRRFRNLILDAQQYEFVKQQKLFIDEFNAWKGENEQIDDFTLVALRV